MRVRPFTLALTLAALSAASGIGSAQGTDGSGSGYATAARRAAARTIAVGSRVEGTLTPSDPTFRDNSHFQVWRFSARRGQEVEIALDSPDFGAFLMLVGADGETQQPLQMASADPASRRARLAMRVPSDGDYLIVANTQQARATGRYRLSVENCVVGSTCVAAGAANIEFTPLNRINVSAARPLALGAAQTEELTRSDARLRDGSYFDAWRYEGRAGERIVIDQNSSDFDTYLILARQTPNGPESLRENDDAPGTQNSQLAVELPATGTYLIVSTSLRADNIGRYGLTLRSMTQACASAGPCEPSAAPSQRLPFFAAVRTAPRRALALGDTIAARLTRSERVLGDNSFFDAYRFVAAANQEVAVFLSSRQPDVGRFDPFLHLLRVEGDSLVVVGSNDDGGGGKNALVTARLPRTGEYVVLANGLSASDTGNYALNVMRLADACAARRVCSVGATIERVAISDVILATPAERIPLGTPVTARLDSGGAKLPDGKPFQPWRYAGRARERIVITNRSREFDAYLYLYRLSGNNLREIGRDDDGGGSLDAQLSVELPEAGDYLVVAGSFSTSATGEYRLTVESMEAACAAGGPCAPGETSAAAARLRPALVATHLSLPLGDTVRSVLPASAPRLESRGRFQSYRFRGRANDRIVIGMESAQFDSYLHLALINGPSLRLIDTDDDGGEGTNSRLVATLPQDGEYLVVASAFSATDTTGFGPYTIRMTACDDACARYSDSAPTRSDASYQLALRTQRRQIPRGGAIEAVLAESDPTLGDGAHFHSYWLQARAGLTLRAALQSTQFDPFLVVFRLEGDSLVRIASDDDSGESINSLLEWPVDRNGTYVVIATAFSRSSLGPYTLNVEQSPEAARQQFLAAVGTAGAREQLSQALAALHRPLQLGQTVTAQMTDETPRLKSRGRFQSYRFRGRANDRVVITMDSAPFDPYLYLAHVDRRSIRLVGTDDDSGEGVNARLVATLPATGEYLVIASAYSASDGTGISPYAIRLDRCDDACAAQRASETTAGSADESAQRVLRAPRRPLPLGTAVRAELVANDSTLSDGSYFHAYSLEASAGMTLRASMESSQFDPYLVLYRVEGESVVRVTSDDDSGEDTNALLEWIVDRSGSYLVIANALSRGSSGSYTLSVSLSPGRQAH